MPQPARTAKAVRNAKNVTPIQPEQPLPPQSSPQSPTQSTAPQSEVSRIQDQLRRAIEGDAWHGPAVLELLQQVPVDLAPAKPLDQAHSIWEIVLHIIAEQNAVVRRLQGAAFHLNQKEDWPEVSDFGEPAWQDARRALEQSFDQLDQSIGRLSDSQLNHAVPGEKYNVYFMLHGIIQHNLYHAGQIALLKKSSR